MDKITKVIGTVTAYGDAVKAGYQGSREDWMRLQMQSGVNAQRAETAANAANESAQSAADSEANAADSAQRAENAAGGAAASQTEAGNHAADAQTSAGQALASASEAASSADAAKTSADAAAASAAEAKATQESIPADYTELVQEVSQLSEEIDDLFDDFSKSYFRETLSFTRNSVIKNLNIPAGEYTVEIANVTSTDTDKNYCSIKFYSNGAYLTAISCPRNQHIKTTINLGSDCDQIAFYACDTASNSTDDDATFEDVRIYQPTNLKLKIDEIDGVIAQIKAETNGIAEIVSTSMTRSEFIAAINAAYDDYATLCKCARWCFVDLKNNMTDADLLHWINQNFRHNVVDKRLSIEENLARINEAFTKPIRRFCDAKLNGGNARDFSLSIREDERSEEPSVIVSEDGSTMYLYASPYIRYSTTDGVNWSDAERLTFNGGSGAVHPCVNLIDGVYYWIGCTRGESADINLVLYTSDDGVNFSYQGILFTPSYEFADGRPVQYWGNPYLIKDYGSGLFYLYIEAQPYSINGEWIPWEINLATCSDILHQNQDGTIGDWDVNYNNPILKSPLLQASGNNCTAGNTDFAKGCDNRPIRVDGKWYLYFHSTWRNKSNILRAYSDNLIDWTLEGIIFDNRNIPQAGDDTSGNADACIIEFKGRTYLFYTIDINTTEYTPHIMYTIDDRPMREILRLKP